MLRAKRRADVLQAAELCARLHGVEAFTREQVAAAAGVSTGLVTLYGGTMDKLRYVVAKRIA